MVIRPIQNVFKQNAIKELMSRESVLRNITVATSYAKDMTIADKIKTEELFEWADKFYNYFQKKTDEVIGEP